MIICILLFIGVSTNADLLLLPTDCWYAISANSFDCSLSLSLKRVLNVISERPDALEENAPIKSLFIIAECVFKSISLDRYVPINMKVKSLVGANMPSTIVICIFMSCGITDRFFGILPSGLVICKISKSEMLSPFRIFPFIFM